MPPVYDVIDVELTPLTIGNVAREIGEGFRYLWDQRVLRWLVVVMSLANLGGVGMRTLILYVLREEHHLDEVTIGLALSVSSIGLVLGSFLVPRVTQGRPMGQSMIASVFLSAVAALATAFAGDWRLITAGFTAREVAWQAFIIFAFIPRQRVPAALRGRANGAFRTLVLISNSASPAVLSAIVVVASSAAAFAVAGLVSLAATAIGAASPLRKYTARETAEDPGTAVA